MGLTFFFRGLVWLWKYLDLHMLRRVLIRTMDILVN